MEDLGNKIYKPHKKQIFTFDISGTMSSRPSPRAHDYAYLIDTSRLNA